MREKIFGANGANISDNFLAIFAMLQMFEFRELYFNVIISTWLPLYFLVSKKHAAMRATSLSLSTRGFSALAKLMRKELLRALTHPH